MGVLNSVGGFFGSMQSGYDDRRARSRQARQDELAREALEAVIALEQQKQQAQNPQIPLRPQEFGMPEQLQLHQAYGKAGIDPVKMAEAQTAQLASEAFAQAIPNVTSDVGRINIGLGKEYKPGVYRQNEAKADEAEFRLRNLQQNFEQITDPLLALDAIQNKSVFDTQKVAIEGKDGKTQHGFATLTPSGTYTGTAVTDQQGQPLNIPVEGSDLPSEVRAIKYYADIWDMPEAEAAKIYKSRATDTPEEAWAKIVNAKSQNRFGNNVKPYDMLKNSMLVWGSSRQGQPLPVDVESTVATYDVNDRQKEELLNLANQVNENARQAALQNAPPPDNTRSSAPAFPFPNMPGFSANQQQTTPFPSKPGAIPTPQPEPLPPVPERQPLTPVAIHTAWTEIQKGTKPEEVQEALIGEGFDLSPESVNMTAIDAVNSGVPADVLQQYLKAIGIEWQP